MCVCLPACFFFVFSCHSKLSVEENDTMEQKVFTHIAIALRTERHRVSQSRVLSKDTGE